MNPLPSTAWWSRSRAQAGKAELKVEASTDGAGAALSVEGYGPIAFYEFDSKKGYRWKFEEKGVADPGPTVTVVSSPDGETAPLPVERKK